MRLDSLILQNYSYHHWEELQQVESSGIDIICFVKRTRFSLRKDRQSSSHASCLPPPKVNQNWHWLPCSLYSLALCLGLFGTIWAGVELSLESRRAKSLEMCINYISTLKNGEWSFITQHCAGLRVGTKHTRKTEFRQGKHDFSAI